MSIATPLADGSSVGIPYTFAATTITATITFGSSNAFFEVSDLSHTQAVLSGDLFGFEIVPTSIVSGQQAIIAASVELV